MRRKGTSFVALVALLASGFTFLETPPAANAAIVTSNLIMNLDGTSSTSLPATGNWASVSPGTGSFSGTITGAARAGGTYGGLNFDGTADSVNFGTNIGAITGSMTYETWIKPGNLPTSAWSIIASRWFSSASTENTVDHDWHFGIYHNGTDARLQLHTTSTSSTPLRGNLVFPTTSNGKWYHVGFRIDAVSGMAQLYVNGVADGSPLAMTHTASTTAQLWIGDARSNANLAFSGQISKARMYGAALTADQFVQNYNSESAFYGLAPTNTGNPVASGTSKVGSTVSTSDGNWLGDEGATVSYKWQSSVDGSSGWTDISGATSNTYTPVTADAGKYLRSAVTKTNANGTLTVYSGSTLQVQTQNGIVIANGGTISGLTGTVPNDANLYNVTLASSNLSSTIALPNNTGLTLVNGYASTASYMATSFAGAAIITFRGTGTAINTALASATFTSTVGVGNTLKLYYARASSTATDTENYIPIYDNGTLTFHYYTYSGSAAASTWSQFQATLRATDTQAGVTSPTNKWYLATPRYQIEDTRIKTLIAATPNVFMGGYANASSSNWYWPANTDGFTSATTYTTGNAGSSNIFNGTNTTLPWQTSQPDTANNVDRAGAYWYTGGVQAWDDVPATGTLTAYATETFTSAPVSSTAAGSLTMSIRTATAPGVPTGMVAGPPGSSVTLSWTAPASSGSDPVTDYLIQYSSDQTTWTTFSRNPSALTSATVTGLTASTVYSFRIAAVTTLQGSWSSVFVSSATAETGGIKNLTGYKVPTNTTGTIRVLLFSSNISGKLWFGSTANINTGIRNTANFPETTESPQYGYVATTLNSAGRMVGLVDTSVTDLNAALATLRYQSPTASTDTISMWISNGSEYVPIVNGSNVEFH
ncbi:MAG: hypothetical protein RL166_621, partial [Actinomycetota bacterium]